MTKRTAIPAFLLTAGLALAPVSLEAAEPDNDKTFAQLLAEGHSIVAAPRMGFGYFVLEFPTGGRAYLCEPAKLSRMKLETLAAEIRTAPCVPLHD